MRVGVFKSFAIFHLLNDDEDAYTTFYADTFTDENITKTQDKLAAVADALFIKPDTAFWEVNYEHSYTFCLSRQVSCTINRPLAYWGKVGHNVPKTRMNTTVSITKV